MYCTYEQGKKIQSDLYKEYDKYSAVVGKFPTGLMGLPTDETRKNPEYREACKQCNLAFAKLRSFNGEFVKKYKKEIQRDYNLKREAKYRA